MQQTYQGSCHCGRVRFELRARLGHVTECSCSLCRRRAALWHGAADGDLRLLSGESELTLYQYLTHTARHYFCRHCGIHPFARPRLDPGMWVVNLRCIDGIDAAALTVHQFDGEHWEEAAQAFLAARRAVSARQEAGTTPADTAG
ncbi:MAG TPA: GFA family protein [Noviherbaspirillum sp.]|jgi:hypothetical protein|uniref:GFA family protein n=1 Tax=Noviherbaspirillum sp. TaxID=1926288 RepID=UPI002F9404D4